MEKEKLKIYLKNIIIFAMIIAGIFFISFKNTSPVIDKNKIAPLFLIEYPAKFNYRQTINDCGPFNTAAVIRALKRQEIDSQKFAEDIKWRLPNKYTLPWGLEKQLRDNGISIVKPDLEPLSNTDKILFLQQQLSQGKPVIILGERDNFEHYITIFGFNASEDKFYIYDSLYDKNPSVEGLTKDDNAEFPGNRTFNSKKLLDFWRGGGIYGIYKWYAIVASSLN